MATVIVQLTKGDIESQMRDMRVWLDARHIEPAVFKYEVIMRGPVAKLAFKGIDEAEAFATEFAGRLINA